MDAYTRYPSVEPLKIIKMKKSIISILSLLALTLTGCEGNMTQEQINMEVASHIIKFNYEGHNYLLYKQIYGKGGIGGITHDPDCPCREKGGEQ